jgi:hypothetical protein
MWDKPCPPQAYAGLADLHLGHPDFVKRYEAIAQGFSDYHAAAMKAHAARVGRSAPLVSERIRSRLGTGFRSPP